MTLLFIILVVLILGFLYSGVLIMNATEKNGKLKIEKRVLQNEMTRLKNSANQIEVLKEELLNQFLDYNHEQQDNLLRYEYADSEIGDEYCLIVGKCELCGAPTEFQMYPNKEAAIAIGRMLETIQFKSESSKCEECFSKEITTPESVEEEMIA